MTGRRPWSGVLVAYPYADEKQKQMRAELVKATAQGMPLLIDSGAFTAHRSGRVISVGEYADFLAALPFTPDHYLTLDVIGDPAGSDRNLHALLKRGLSPVPVFTYGEAPEKLEELYAISPSLVAIGGLVRRRDRIGYLKFLRDHLRGRPYHLLGATTPATVQFMRPYSADSSSWESARRYGKVLLYCGAGRWRTFGRSDVPAFIRDPSMLRLIRAYGVSPRTLLDEDGWRGSFSHSALLTVRSWLTYQQDTATLLGSRVYLATSSYHSMMRTNTEYAGICSGAWSYPLPHLSRLHPGAN